MKRYSLIIICLLFGLIGFTQTQRTIDSLNNGLNIATSDTARVSILLNLASRYTYTKPDTALLYAEKSVKLLQNKKNDIWKCNAIGTLGSINREIGNLPLALELSLKSLRIAQKIKNYTGIRMRYNSIGLIYLDLMDYKKSINYYQQSRKVPDTTKTNDNEAGLLMNIGSAYTSNNQLDSASYYLKKSLHLSTKEGLLSKSGTFLYRNLGNLEVKRGNQKQALEYYFKSIEYCDDDNYRNLAATNNKIAAVYLTNKQIDSTIYYAEKALLYGEKGPFRVIILESSKLLADVYKSKNDFKKALEYQELMIKIKEKLYGAGNIEAIQVMVYQEQKRNDEIEASRLAYENKLKQYGYLSGVGFLVLISLFLYRNSKQKQKANNRLQVQKEKVEYALIQLKATQSQLIQSEKMASLGELTAGIAHEIQNPLNFVNNFSEVSAELLEEIKEERTKNKEERDEELVSEILDDIKQNLEKINHHGKRADTIVKGMLQHSRSSSGTKEPTDINKLADEYLRLAYHGLRAKDNSFNATLVTNYDETIGKINIIPQDIGRVILNLITNAFYATNEKQKTSEENYEPTVTISTKKIENLIEVSIKDNGNGIPQKVLDKIFQPFFTTKPTGQGTGLGLSLSYDIVKVHGGELKVETKEGVGSEFIITLPLKN
jgi:two-component system NtrC family sensor kinase